MSAAMSTHRYFLNILPMSTLGAAGPLAADCVRAGNGVVGLMGAVVIVLIPVGRIRGCQAWVGWYAGGPRAVRVVRMGYPPPSWATRF